MLLELKNLRGGYEKSHSILNGINLTINSNETVAIIGQNGAGKSTLAKAIMGILPFYEGKLKLKDQEIGNIGCHKIQAAGIGYFMQGGRIFQHLSSIENLSFVSRKLENKYFINRFKNLCNYFPLLQNKRKLHLEASYLSGGERHQLALAMVLINQPQLLILDEPSAGLSPSSTEQMYDVLEQIRSDSNIGIILIEQNISKAISFSDRLILLRNGRIEKNIDVKKEDLAVEISDFFFE